MTEPTEQRIEAAAKALAFERCDGTSEEDRTDCITSGKCHCVQFARAALTADAPFAASEYERGREDEAKAIQETTGAAEVRAYEDGMRHARAPILARSLAIAEARGFADGLKEARKIAIGCPVKTADGVIVNDIKEERDAEIIAALDARLSAVKP